MEKVETKDILNMVATMCAGIFSNPTAGYLMTNQYERQQIIQQMIWDVKSAVQAAGITIEGG